jgi:hypothetical protein
MRSLSWFVMVVIVVGCAGKDTSSEPGTSGRAAPDVPQSVEARGLHNVFRISDRLYSGSSPEGDEGFQSLHELGVRTVISVDGAKPDVARARKFALRYVHIPFGYDGVPRQTGLRLARAVRDLPGPIYLHCHHGKHRGPAAAAVVQRCLDRRCGTEQALAWLRLAGTDPHYVGLFAAPGRFHLLNDEELERVSPQFPEVATLTVLAEQMVTIDERWERIKRVRAAGWKVPPNHPDLDPAHEALLLREAYREAGRGPQLRQRSEELHRWMVEAEEGAKELEAVLRMGKGEHPAIEKAYQRAAGACSRCHARYRDRPQPPASGKK